MRQGSIVRLVQPVIQGEVKARRINDTTDKLELLVVFADTDGTITERWFDEDQLEAVE